ncbi:MAG: hypothetical protein LUC50_07100 [Ruminococcus sp.]|nr:hypothetical protein [Ruminococcus sp.]
MMHKKRLLNCAVSLGMIMVIAGSLTGCGSKTYTFDYDSTRANNGVDALELLGYEFDIDEDDFTTTKLSGSTLTIEGYGSWKANKFNETKLFNMSHKVS